MRLTAEDGYQAQRRYSIASAPEDASVVLTVERLDDGEVSPYLADELRVGDNLELRGPVGGYFVWEASLGGLLLLLADWPPNQRPLTYVCGPRAFVETAASTLVALGHEPDRIRTERFGLTGG